MISVDEINKLKEENIKMKKLLLKMKGIALVHKLFKGFNYGYFDISKEFVKDLEDLGINL